MRYKVQSLSEIRLDTYNLYNSQMISFKFDRRRCYLNLNVSYYNENHKEKKDVF